jgi:hypothetical protein
MSRQPRLALSPVEGKAAADWDEAEHPRDRAGRFIEVGGWVRIWGGAEGRVVANVGGGRLEVDRVDGVRVRVHRNYLTVVERPDGGAPSRDAEDAVPAPVEAPSAEAVDDDAKPVYAGGEDEGTATPSPPQEDTMTADDTGDAFGDLDLPDTAAATEAQAIATIRRDGIHALTGSEIAALPEDMRAAVEDDDEPRVRELLRQRRRALTPDTSVDFDEFTLSGDEPVPAQIDDAVADQPNGSLTVLDATVADRGIAPEVEPEDGEVETTEVTYDYPAWRDEQAIASLNAANRRAERAGIPERFTWTVEHYEQAVAPAYPGGPQRYETRSRLTLNRPTVQREGWAFVATLTWDEEAGLVTRVVPDATLQERPEARKCDVCKATRDRRDTYVVQQVDGNRELQVGSNCLQQFLGISPAGLWLLNFEPDTGGDGDDDPLGRGGSGNYRQASRDVLAVGLALVNEHGWVPRSRADERTMATAERLMMLLHDRGPTRPPQAVREWEAYRDKIMGEARAREDEATTLLDFARTMEGDTDYAINMRAVATPDTVDERNIPLLVSAVAASNARRERDARERAARDAAQVSEHVGTVGDKITDTPARVVGVRTMEGNYGTTTLFTLVDDNGNIYKWFASGNKTDLASIDDRVTVSGTIKGHGQYRGVNETNLTRAKISPTGEALERLKAEEAAAKAARKAERDRVKALRQRLSDPTPEGFTRTSGAQPVGSRVRIVGGDGSGYHGYGRVLFDPVDDRQMVQIEAMTGEDRREAPDEFYYDIARQIPVERIVATEGEPTDRDIDTAGEFMQRLRQLPGQERPVSTYQVENPEALLRNTYPAGTLVRVSQPGTMSPVLYVDVPVLRIEPADPDDRYGTPTIVVRMPDGSERVLSPSSIEAYTPA